MCVGLSLSHTSLCLSLSNSLSLSNYSFPSDRKATPSSPPQPDLLLETLHRDKETLETRLREAQATIHQLQTDLDRQTASSRLDRQAREAVALREQVADQAEQIEVRPGVGWYREREG